MIIVNNFLFMIFGYIDFKYKKHAIKLHVFYICY